MYRSCSTWQYQIASHLVEKHLGGRRLGFLFGNAFSELIQTPTEPGWQVLKSHDRHPAFARALAEGQALALYSYRDLRDVAFSLMHKFDLSFSDVLFKERLLEDCLANDRFWTGQLNVLCQRYENIIRDPVEAIEVLADHLRISLSEGESEALAREYSFEANLERTQAIRDSFSDIGIDFTKHENALACDSHSLLHWNHLRIWQFDSWAHLTNQSERADLARVCGEWLIARGYEQDQSWVEVTADEAWRQFDCVRNELGQTRRQVIELEDRCAELTRTRLEAQRHCKQNENEIEQCRQALVETKLQIQEDARQRRELETAKAAATLQLADTWRRIDEQNVLVEDLKLRIAELESLGPLTLRFAGKWRKLSNRYPKACTTLRSVAQRIFRLAS
jgi:hypothetical protein